MHVDCIVAAVQRDRILVQSELNVRMVNVSSSFFWLRCGFLLIFAEGAGARSPFGSRTPETDICADFVWRSPPDMRRIGWPISRATRAFSGGMPLNRHFTGELQSKRQAQMVASVSY